MAEKKFYVAPTSKVHQIAVESMILTASGYPEGQSNESYEEGSTATWF